MRARPNVLVSSYYARAATDPVLARLQPVATVRRVDLAPDAREAFLAALQGCAVAVVSGERFDARTFAAAPELRLVCCDGTGVDHIDLRAATDHGVTITNAPVVHEACADLAMALILAVVRRILTADEGVRAGRWNDRSRYVAPRDVYGSTLGLLGFGRVGEALARRAQGFGMNLIAHSPHADPARLQAAGVRHVDFDELLAQADILSIHVRLTEEKRGLIGAREISLMKNGAYLVNTSRGAVIDEAALAVALREGKIAGAGLDVLAQEPPAGDHPLFQLKNVVLSPHVGSDTDTSFARVFHCVVDDILLYLGGQAPKNIMNPAILQRGLR